MSYSVALLLFVYFIEYSLISNTVQTVWNFYKAIFIKWVDIYELKFGISLCLNYLYAKFHSSLRWWGKLCQSDIKWPYKWNPDFSLKFEFYEKFKMLNNN